jgi:hypothetical protein
VEHRREPIDALVELGVREATLIVDERFAIRAERAMDPERNRGARIAEERFDRGSRQTARARRNAGSYSDGRVGLRQRSGSSQPGRNFSVS